MSPLLIDREESTITKKNVRLIVPPFLVMLIYHQCDIETPGNPCCGHTSCGCRYLGGGAEQRRKKGRKRRRSQAKNASEISPAFFPPSLFRFLLCVYVCAIPTVLLLVDKKKTLHSQDTNSLGKGSPTHCSFPFLSLLHPSFFSCVSLDTRIQNAKAADDRAVA